MLSHCGLVVPYGDIDLGLGLCQGKPSPQPMSTYHTGVLWHSPESNSSRSARKLLPLTCVQRLHICNVYIAQRPLIYILILSTCLLAFVDIDPYVDVLVQDCSNSSALAMELLQSCTKISMYVNTSVHVVSAVAN